MRVPFVFLFLLLFAPLLPADESSSNEKRIDHEISQQSELFQFFEALQNTFSAQYKGLSPWIGSITSASGLSVGLGYGNPAILGSDLDLQAKVAYSVLGYRQYSIQIGQIPESGSERILENDEGIARFHARADNRKKLFYSAQVEYHNYPQVGFYGIGFDSLKADRTDYRTEQTSYDTVIEYRWKTDSSASFRFGYLQHLMDEGTDRWLLYTDKDPCSFLFQSFPGLQEQTGYLRFSSNLLFDKRDRVVDPRDGGLLFLGFSAFKDIRAGKYDFVQASVDLRQYHPLGSPSRLLALHAQSFFSYSGSQNEVPFYMMPVVGGSETLRGFASSRFRNKNSFVLTAEYRWEATPMLGFVVFYDAGKVFSGLNQLNLKGVQKSHGVGVRFKLRDSVVMGFDTALSKEGTQYYLRFSNSF